MNWEELNFTKICRCCKRTESGMASIFDGKAHPTYPPVTEMLRTIASLNMHENDGLPSLVCTSCLDNIQDAYTFILQLTLIHDELSQVLAKRKQADANTNQCITTDSVKKENVHDSEDVPANHCYENIDLVVKHEMNDINETNSLSTDEDNTNDSANLDQDVDAAENVIGPKIDIEEVSPQLRAKRRKTTDAVQHTSDERKEGKESSCDLLIIPKVEDMQDFEDIDDTVADMDYQVAVEEEDSEEIDDMEEDEDYQMDVEDANSSDSSDDAAKDVDIDEVGPKSETKRKTLSKLNLFKCKLCVYTCTYMCLLKTHLRTHCKDKQFACSKCNGTFTRRYHLLTHSRKCNGELPKINKVKAAKQVLALTLQDLKDPEKLKEFYIVTEIGVQNNNDVANVQKGDDEAIALEEACPKRRKPTPNSSKITLFKCTLCAYNSVQMNNLRVHLQTHFKYRPFACSKCNLTYARRDNMLVHWQKCNGHIKRRRGRHKEEETSKQVLAMTLEDLKDPLKMKRYYTESEIDVQNNGDNDDKEEGRGTTSESNVLKCNRCEYSGRNIATLKYHLQSHSKDIEFACSKCNVSFGRKYRMLRHSQSCNVHSYTRLKKENQVLGLSMQDLEDPEKIDTKGNDLEGQGQQRSEDKEDGVKTEEICLKSGKVRQRRRKKCTAFKCKLCGYTNSRMSHLKLHFQSHSNLKPFACFKCNGTFTTRYHMLRHCQNCKGDSNKVRRNKGSALPTLSLTLEDLNDPEKIKDYYYTVTEVEMQNNDDNDDAELMRGPDLNETKGIVKLKG